MESIDLNKFKVRIFFIIVLSLFLLFMFLFIYFDFSFFNSPNKNCIGLEGDKLDTCILLYQKCSNDDCYYKKSILFLNYSLCSNIEDSNLRVKCSSIVNHNKIYTDSILKNNISLCNNLEGKLFIEKCRDNYYYIKSEEVENVSLCKFILNESVRNDCERRN